MIHEAGNVKVLVPDAASFEGAPVQYRSGKNYFMWWEDVTSSPNYRICYSIAAAPLEPVKLHQNYLVLARSERCYNLGHRSPLQHLGAGER